MVCPSANAVTHPSTSRCSQESNSRPSSRESSALTTRLPNHAPPVLCVLPCVAGKSLGTGLFAVSRAHRRLHPVLRAQVQDGVPRHVRLSAQPRHEGKLRRRNRTRAEGAGRCSCWMCCTSAESCLRLCFLLILILYIIFPIVCLYALTLYPARADCAAATDISGVTGCWQLSR